MGVDRPPQPQMPCLGYNSPMHSTVSMKKAAYWMDIVNPQQKHLDWLKREFNIHPVILEELKTPSARSRAEVHEGYVYFIYYFPEYDPVEETSIRTEIDFLVTRNHVVTVRYKAIESLRGVPEKAENSIKLLYLIVESLLQFQERQLAHIQDKVEAIGRDLFKDKEKEILRRVARLKRDISEYRIIIRHQGTVLHSVASRVGSFGDSVDAPYLADLAGDHLKIVNQLDDYREAILDYEDTNNQNMNLKINAIMKTFTILSFLTFPFMLLAALFSMNTPGVPLSSTPGGFWIVLAAMAVAMVSLVAFFKKKGWF